MSVTLTKTEMLVLCKTYGLLLKGVPDGIDPVLLLWALSGNESSFGAICAPRHEPAYDRGGKYAESPDQQKLLELYDSRAACSYGPFQIMLVNAIGYTPDELDGDAEKATEAAVAFINRRIFGAKYPPQTVFQFADDYNSGHWKGTSSPEVIDYAEKFERIYNMGLPAEEGS